MPKYIVMPYELCIDRQADQYQDVVLVAEMAQEGFVSTLCHYQSEGRWYTIRVHNILIRGKQIEAANPAEALRLYLEAE